MAAANEHVIDDIAILEAALARATERKSDMSPQWTPLRDAPQLKGHADLGAQVSPIERERFGKSVSSYAQQLKSWVDMQVDARLKIVIRDIENEVLVSRQESRSALELARLQQDSLAKVECLLLSVDGHTRRETAEVQQETLATVEDLMRTVDELKRTSVVEIDELRRLHGDQDKFSINQAQDVQKDMDQKLMNWRTELLADVDTAWKQQAIHVREFENLQQAVCGNLEGKLETLRNEVDTAANKADLDELQVGFERNQRRLGDDLIAHQQRLISELRSETTLAFKNEAASFKVLDEQVWLTDQRLGQRIEQVAQQYGDAAAAIDDLVRSHNDVRRTHGESMSRIKGLAQSHRELLRSHSPEHHRIGGLTERPLRSPQSYEAGDDERERSGLGACRSMEEDQQGSEMFGPPSRKGKTFEELSQRPRSLWPRGDGSVPGAGRGLAMARAAGDAFADKAALEQSRPVLRQ